MVEYPISREEPIEPHPLTPPEGGAYIPLKDERRFVQDSIARQICLAERTGLHIEVDGGYHDDTEQRENDWARTIALSRMGFQVIRFDNADVLQDIEKVVDRILEEIE